MTMDIAPSGRSPEPLCNPAASLVQLAEQTIFSKVTPNRRVSPEQVQAAKALLQGYYEKQLATLGVTHYPAAYGSHWCVSDAFEQLSFRIAALGLGLPEKEQAPEPAAVQPLLSAADVVTNLRRLTEEQTRRRGTYLGQEIPQPPPENTR
jgi:hypothetical protein